MTSPVEAADMGRMMAEAHGAGWQCQMRARAPGNPNALRALDGVVAGSAYFRAVDQALRQRYGIGWHDTGDGPAVLDRLLAMGLSPEQVAGRYRDRFGGRK
jgi:hypothetical protein